MKWVPNILNSFLNILGAFKYCIKMFENDVQNLFVTFCFAHYWNSMKILFSLYVQLKIIGHWPATLLKMSLFYRIFFSLILLVKANSVVSANVQHQNIGWKWVKNSQIVHTLRANHCKHKPISHTDHLKWEMGLARGEGHLQSSRKVQETAILECWWCYHECYRPH